ncbi:MAG TPA: GNAT family N-acetyltransferase [Anaerolineales bacterium]|nr:GNAT family N-acetyltransferase [Anaerolineales bacterium]
MENITSRFCDYQKDLEKLMGFWLEYRAASDTRTYPTIWRIRLLLTSRVWDQEKDTQIWEDKSGQIIGFALLWSRQPASSYIVLDSFVHPKFASDRLLSAILDWGDFRVNEIVREQKTPLSVYVTGFSQYDFSAKILKKRNYTLFPPNPSEHNVYFSKSLQNGIPSPTVPMGYEIRKLQGADDLKAYQTLYGFSKVNPVHQRELIESKEYCHLVIVSPDGEFVAYCECSVCYAEWKRTNQRIGWIDYVETKPEQQKKGFGRAILTAALSQLKAFGADIAMLITINTNTSAVTLYNKTGFERVDVKEHPSYEKQIFS